VHTADNPRQPTYARTRWAAAVPSTWEKITGVKEWPRGLALWRLIKQELGDQASWACQRGIHLLAAQSDEIYEFTTTAENYDRRAEMPSGSSAYADHCPFDVKPDFLLCGVLARSSSSRRDLPRLALPVLKRHLAARDWASHPCPFLRPGAGDGQGGCP